MSRAVGEDINMLLRSPEIEGLILQVPSKERFVGLQTISIVRDRVAGAVWWDMWGFKQ